MKELLWVYLDIKVGMYLDCLYQKVLLSHNLMSFYPFVVACDGKKDDSRHASYHDVASELIHLVVKGSSNL